VTVRRFLGTAPVDRKMLTCAATGMFANWLEGRENGDRETWLVTVFDEDAEAFLDTARNIGVTVEEIGFFPPPSLLPPSPPASGLTRLRQGKHLSADGLAALVAWLYPARIPNWIKEG
jgi:hypothetical protein